MLKSKRKITSNRNAEKFVPFLRREILKIVYNTFFLEERE